MHNKMKGGREGERQTGREFTSIRRIVYVELTRVHCDDMVSCERGTHLRAHVEEGVPGFMVMYEEQKGEWQSAMSSSSN